MVSAAWLGRPRSSHAPVANNPTIMNIVNRRRSGGPNPLSKPHCAAGVARFHGTVINATVAAADSHAITVHSRQGTRTLRKA